MDGQRFKRGQTNKFSEQLNSTTRTKQVLMSSQLFFQCFRSKKHLFLLILFFSCLIIIYQAMLKHKLIIKEFKYRERIRRSYGLQRLKTIYQPEDSPQNEQQVQEISEQSSSSSNEEFFCFQGNFLIGQGEEPTCDYNPYDFFINEANNLFQTPQSSKIAALNAAFLASMKLDDQTSPAPEKRVSFDREVQVIYFDAESPIDCCMHRSETCSISWA